MYSSDTVLNYLQLVAQELKLVELLITYQQQKLEAINAFSSDGAVELDEQAITAAAQLAKLHNRRMTKHPDTHFKDILTASPEKWQSNAKKLFTRYQQKVQKSQALNLIIGNTINRHQVLLSQLINTENQHVSLSPKDHW